MRRLEQPIKLHYNQFGLIAFAVLLFAVLPELLSFRGAEHVMYWDITDLPKKAKPMVVAVEPDSSIWTNGKLVSLNQLEDMAKAAQVADRPVLLKPDPCANYNVVALAIVTLKRSGVVARLAPPDFPTIFGKPSGDRLSQSQLERNGADMPRAPYCDLFFMTSIRYSRPSPVRRRPMPRL